MLKNGIFKNVGRYLFQMRLIFASNQLGKWLKLIACF